MHIAHIIDMSHYTIVQRYSRIIDIPPSKSVVKAWFCKFSNSLQQTTDNSEEFSVFRSHSIPTVASNCRNLRGALPSLEEDGRKHTLYLVLKLPKRSSCLAVQVQTHKYHIHTAGHHSRRSRLEANTHKY